MEDFPKLRAIEMIPVSQGGREMILLRDPEGLTEEQLVISKELAFVLLMMDGSRSLRDIQVEYMRTFGDLLYMEKLKEVIASLNERYLLHSPHAEKRLAALKEEYAQVKERPPALAGKSYPFSKEELLSFLKELFSSPKQEGEENGKSIRGMLSPHIDYLRGREVYASTYVHLKRSEAKLAVIFGTSHKPIEKMWAISLKNFSSPLGTLTVPEKLKEIISASSLRAYIDEWPHRWEHSIELQIPLLTYFLGKEIAILPILTGNMADFIAGQRKDDDGEVSSLLVALKDCLEQLGESYLILAAADLAHIGRQFGDLYPLSDSVLARSKVRDKMILDSIERCDAGRFLALIREEGDSRRICGLAPIYFQLRLLEGLKCQIVSYKQWTDGASSVSFAGGIFYEEHKGGE